MSGFTEDQMDELRDAFFVHGNDKTGWVTIKQLGGVMRTLGQSLTEAELYSLGNEYCGHRGLVYFNEFLQIMAKRTEEQNSTESLQQAFSIFDRNDMAYFTIVEVKAVMTNLGEKISDQDLSDMFREIDLDNDGKVTFADFITALRG